MNELLWKLLIVALLSAILYLCLCIHTNLKCIGEKISQLLDKQGDK